MPGEHSDGWESYWTYRDRWGVPHLEPLNVLRYLRRADGNGAYSASFSKRPMTPKLGYIQPTGTLIFLEVTTAFHHLNIYICIYVHTVRLWPPLGTMRWMIPFRRHCFLVAFVHRYRLGYIPSSHYTYILFREQFIYIYRYIIFIYIFNLRIILWKCFT